MGVVGTLQQSSYESNGEKRTTYTVMINSFDFLESRNTTEQEPQYQPPQATKSGGDRDDDIEVDDFPF